jgi:hypothetical protein
MISDRTPSTLSRVGGTEWLPKKHSRIVYNGLVPMSPYTTPIAASVSGSKVRREVRRLAAGGICEVTGVSAKTCFRKTPAGLADGLGLGSVRRHVAAAPRGGSDGLQWFPRISRVARNFGLVEATPRDRVCQATPRGAPLPSMLRWLTSGAIRRVDYGNMGNLTALLLTKPAPSAAQVHSARAAEPMTIPVRARRGRRAARRGSLARSGAGSRDDPADACILAKRGGKRHHRRSV